MTFIQYTGMIDAERKIYKAGGVPALYRGFWIIIIFFLLFKFGWLLFAILSINKLSLS